MMPGVDGIMVLLTGYVALWEIVSASEVLVLAVRHQREEDYHRRRSAACRPARNLTLANEGVTAPDGAGRAQGAIDGNREVGVASAFEALPAKTS
jgi:hypothetical protein